MAKPGTKASLYLNGVAVGTVTVHGANESWEYGDFQPGEGFAKFAPIFGQWSLLMHADEREKLSEAASEELRQVEYDMDALRARLHFPEKDEWRDLAQINIDGPLIEWKLY